MRHSLRLIATDHVYYALITIGCLMLLINSNGASNNLKPMVLGKHFKDVDTEASSVDSGDGLHAIRKKRRLMSPFSIQDYGYCQSQPSCQGLRNVTSDAVGNENVYYASTKEQILKIQVNPDSTSLCVCTVLYNSTIPVLSIVADDSYIYWLSPDLKKVMYFTPDDNSPHVPEVLELSQETLARDKKHVHAACRIPRYIPNLPNPTVTAGSFFEFDLTEINATQYRWFNSPVCIHENNPNISFAFVYAKRSSISTSDGIRGMCFNSANCIYKRISYSTHISSVRLDELLPDSDYVVRLILYCPTHRSAIVTSPTILRTSCGVSSPVSDLQCRGISDEELEVTWGPPAVVNSDKVRYEVYRDVTSAVNDFEQLDDLRGRLTYRGKQGLTYSFTVRALPVNCSQFDGQYSTATVSGCRAFLPPVKPAVVNVTDTRAILSWDSPADNSAQNVILQWTLLEDFQQRQNTERTWSKSEVLNGNETLTYPVTDLMADSPYSFRAYQQYVGYTGDKEGWMYSEEVNSQTLPGVPGFPGNVRVEGAMPNYELVWTAPDPNGADLNYYEISYRNRSSPNATRILYGPWVIGLNRSAKFTDWEITGLAEGVWYEFRVSAANDNGHGDTSLPSAPFFYSKEQDAEVDYQVWFVGLSAGILVIVIIITFILARRCCWKKPPGHRTPTSSEITTIHLSYGTDLQLAQIRHMTELANWKGIPNIPQDYMDLLPLFPREKLTLTDFLGKGAFGEVYKGIAFDVDGDGIEKKVAVKTLREESTDSEKCEFLMEAYFMSNFDHKNILSLLGVCLDNEPQYLILELMEGGDLLRYLREARPNPIMGPKLTTDDLLDICLDVAAGCKYLEEQRFIHRDLASRNCLVSTKAYRTESRVVKIGDFGLARDIYKNDYYHKAGEGLLPVRWMSPESLVDNLYTTQSDVWSFGVLLWEIMTFGQQPYPTRTNLEVLQLVRAGGRLEKPDHCPDDMHALMLKCWHATPSLRPSFSWALEWLQEFKRRNLVNLDDEEYAADVPNINYTTVTTSEEDLVDEDSQTSSDLPRSPENRFTAAVMGIENDAFERQEQSPRRFRFPPDSAVSDGSGRGTPNWRHTQARNRLREAQQCDTGNSYLRISMDPEFNQPPGGQINESSHTDREDDVGQGMDLLPEDALNYSVLGFPPSRNPSTRSNATTPKEVHSARFTLPSVDEAFALSTMKDYSLLPYMGDLPITDEERLMRKQHWTRRNRFTSPTDEARLSSGHNECPTTSSNLNRLSESSDYDELSPYMRGSSFGTNHEYVNEDGSQPSTSRSHHSQSDSSSTRPKRTYDLEGNVITGTNSEIEDTSDRDAGNDRTIHITLKDQDRTFHRANEDTFSDFSGESMSGAEFVEELTRHWARETNVASSSSSSSLSPSPEPRDSTGSVGNNGGDEEGGDENSLQEIDSSDEEVNYSRVKVTMNVPTYV